MHVIEGVAHVRKWTNTGPAECGTGIRGVKSVAISWVN